MDNEKQKYIPPAISALVIALAIASCIPENQIVQSADPLPPTSTTIPLPPSVSEYPIELTPEQANVLTDCLTTFKETAGYMEVSTEDGDVLESIYRGEIVAGRPVSFDIKPGEMSYVTVISAQEVDVEAGIQQKSGNQTPINFFRLFITKEEIDSCASSSDILPEYLGEMSYWPDQNPVNLGRFLPIDRGIEIIGTYQQADLQNSKEIITSRIIIEQVPGADA